MRYENVTTQVYEVLEEVRDKYFDDLQNAKIKCLFDTKKRMRGKKVVIAAIKKTNDLLKHLTAEEAKKEEGFDYIIFIDKVAWENTVPEDRIRLLRHELRHSLVCTEDVKDPYRIEPHDIEDFVEEVKLNADDPGWANRVSTLVSDIYDQRKEEEKEAKKLARKQAKKNKTN
jgi:hypothetical protein